MKKTLKAITAFLLCTLLALSPLVAYAESNVTYDGNAREFIFAPGSDHSPTDLFEAFKLLMPGDTRTQTITVKNDADKKTDIKVYLRSLGAAGETEEEFRQSTDFLSQLTLSVSSDEKTLFEAPADEKATLSDWVCLGLIHSGAQVPLTLTLQVPLTLSNEYADRVAFLDWEFKVEEIPVIEETTEAETTTEPIETTTEKVEPTSAETTTAEETTTVLSTVVPTAEKPTTNHQSSPKTSDVNDVYLYASLGAVCLLAMAVTVFLLIKRKKESE